MTPETTRNWSKFKADFSRPNRSYVHISINKRGKIQLNSYLMDKLDYARSASLYYDRETSSIGIMPRRREDEDEDALPINMRAGREYGEIYALSFLHCYNIKIRKTLATNHVETTPDGMLIIDLRHAYEVARSERAFNPAKM